jgi:fibronectin-binding autotransporter adhesin
LNLWTNNGGDSAWTTANNWNNSPAATPASGSDVLLDNSSVSTAQNISISGNQVIRSLQFDAPFSYTLTGGSLEFSGTGASGIFVNQTHGTAVQTVGSNLTADNAIQIQNNSPANLSLTGTVGLAGNALTFNGSSSVSVSGIVSGTGTVTQSGTGNTTLSAVNTYSGGTTLTTGTLTANNNTALGTGGLTINGGTLASTNGSTISNTVTLQGNAGLSGITSSGTLTQTGGSDTLTMASATQSGTVNLSDNNTARTLTVQVNSGNSTISGVIQNGGTSAGNLTKTGAGTLILSGTDTFTGTTTVNAGSVQLGASNVLSDSSNVSLAGGTLNLNGNSEKINNLTFSNGGTLDFGAVAGNNTFVFNTFSGTPTGVLTINNYNGTGDYLGALTSGISSTILNQIYFTGIGAGVTEQGSTNSAGNGLGNAFQIIPTTPTWNYVWVSNGTTSNSQQWSRGSDWGINSPPPNSLSPPAYIQFGTGTQTSVNFDTNSTINALQFTSSAASYSITDSGSHTLTLQNGSSLVYVQQQSANNETLSPANLVIKNNAVFDVTGAGNLTVGAVISDGASSFSLTKTGSGGRLILTKSNTYDGGTFVEAGILQAQNSGAFGTGTVTIENGGAVELTGGISPTNAFSVSGTGVSGNGAIDNVSGTNTLSGLVTLATDSTIKSDAGTLTLSGGVTGTNVNLTLGGAGNITASSAITTGTGGLTLNGSGTTTLSGAANTFTGNTTINSGILTLSKAANTTAIAGNLTVNGGTVNENASGQIATSSTVNVNAGTFAMATGTTQTLQTLNTASGSTVSVGSGSTLTLNTSGSNTINGTVSGAGALSTQGTGTTILTNSNTYSGGTTIGSIVSASNGSSLGTGAVAVNSGGNLEVQGGITVANNFTLNSTGTTASDGAVQNISGNNTFSGNFTVSGNSRLQSDSGTLTLSGTVGLGSNTLNVGGAGATTLSGVVSGTGGLTKDGAGTLIASAINTYSGATAINAGTLQLGTNGALGSSTAVTVASGATFDVNGKTDTISSIAGAGTLAIGSGALIAGDATNTTFSGSITGTGSLTKQGSGTLTISGNINFGGNLAVNAGTLQFSSTLPSIAGTLTLGTGSTLLLSGSDLTVGTVHITGNTVIDFGSSSASILNASNFLVDSGATVTINNWANTVDFFYAQNWTGATLGTVGTGPETQVTFNGFTSSQTAWVSFDHEISPAPEPATYGALFMSATLALLGWRRYQKKSSGAAGTAVR